jgi:hypothetical protein
MKHQPTHRSIKRFGYFAQCQDTLRLPAIPFNPEGHTAAECFHAHETYGKSLPCREPELLSRALNGKEQHGITVTMIAEDYVGRILFACDIRNGYPEWVQKDIFGRARQIAMQVIGYVPTFVRTGIDFSIKTPEPLLSPPSLQS